MRAYIRGGSALSARMRGQTERPRALRAAEDCPHRDVPGGSPILDWEGTAFGHFLAVEA